MSANRKKAVLTAMDVATVSLKQIADEAGLSEDSLYFYRLGKRSPSPEAVEALAKVLQRHEQKLIRAMQKLRKAAG